MPGAPAVCVACFVCAGAGAGVCVCVCVCASVPPSPAMSTGMPAPPPAATVASARAALMYRAMIPARTTFPHGPPSVARAVIDAYIGGSRFVAPPSPLGLSPIYASQRHAVHGLSSARPMMPGVDVPLHMVSGPISVMPRPAAAFSTALPVAPVVQHAPPSASIVAVPRIAVRQGAPLVPHVVPPSAASLVDAMSSLGAHVHAAAPTLVASLSVAPPSLTHVLPSSAVSMTAETLQAHAPAGAHAVSVALLRAASVDTALPSVTGNFTSASRKRCADRGVLPIPRRSTRPRVAPVRLDL